MPRPSQAEIDESFDRTYGLPDDEDEALLDHVMWPNGRPRQGLHAKPEEWEEESIADFLYGGGFEDE